MEVHWELSIVDIETCCVGFTLSGYGVFSHHEQLHVHYTIMLCRNAVLLVEIIQVFWIFCCGRTGLSKLSFPHFSGRFFNGENRCWPFQYDIDGPKTWGLGIVCVALTCTRGIIPLSCKYLVRSSVVVWTPKRLFGRPFRCPNTSNGMLKYYCSILRHRGCGQHFCVHAYVLTFCGMWQGRWITFFWIFQHLR